MDIGTVVGIVLGSGLVLVAILIGPDALIFLNVSSLLIVFGGTIASTLMKNDLKAVIAAAGVAKNAFFTKSVPPEDLLAQIVDMARQARRESLLALEKVPVEDAFLKQGVQMCVDGVEPDLIRAILETEIDKLEARHGRGRLIFEGIGDAAPAFGMIGTLIGLVQMLVAMDDPKNIGPAMAVAILTTLYGALIANVVSLPVAEKLKLRSEEEVLAMQLVMQGVLALVEGFHPAAVEQKLQAFLAPKLRVSSDAQG